MTTTPTLTAQQLYQIVYRYPVRPREVLSLVGLTLCVRRGWVVRDVTGSWIPTANGVLEARR